MLTEKNKNFIEELNFNKLHLYPEDFSDFIIDNASLLLNCLENIDMDNFIHIFKLVDESYTGVSIHIMMELTNSNKQFPKIIEKLKILKQNGFVSKIISTPSRVRLISAMIGEMIEISLTHFEIKQINKNGLTIFSY